MTIRLKDISSAVRKAEYAVRGPIVDRAMMLERSGREIIYCNIGNPQALGQKPLSWVRQVLALTEYPELIKSCSQAMPSDVIQTAEFILKHSKFGLGAYTESKGMRFVREAVAAYIQRRDDISADPDSIYLTDGASKGVQTVLRMIISSSKVGVLIPIPQYPLYSATITLLGGKQVPYFLDEESGWKLSRRLLDSAIRKAKSEGTNVKAIVVINPGNPTGSVLDHENIKMIVEFARKHDLAILADEVYQDNIYGAHDKFVSFAKVLDEMSEKNLPLFSFHSCSKGFIGECGQRGGYFECRNVLAEVINEITKLQSINLCSNSVGQIVTYLLIKPPRQGDPSYPLYQEEKNAILDTLRKNAKIMATGLNGIEGFSCQEITGAMYAFPTVNLPKGRTDFEYCLELLEKKGICVVPGSGFGQKPGTLHFRTTILPPTDKIEYVVKEMADFHRNFR